MPDELSHGDLLRHSMVQAVAVEDHALEDGEGALQDGHIHHRLVHVACNLGEEDRGGEDSESTQVGLKVSESPEQEPVIHWKLNPSPNEKMNLNVKENTSSESFSLRDSQGQAEVCRRKLSHIHTEGARHSAQE